MKVILVLILTLMIILMLAGGIIKRAGGYAGIYTAKKEGASQFEIVGAPCNPPIAVLNQEGLDMLYNKNQHLPDFLPMSVLEINRLEETLNHPIDYLADRYAELPQVPRRPPVNSEKCITLCNIFNKELIEEKEEEEEGPYTLINNTGEFNFENILRSAFRMTQTSSIGFWDNSEN